MTIMKQTKLFGTLLSLLVVVMLSSCGKDDDPVIQVEEGLKVADGFYLAKVGEDPEATAQLTSASVDGPDFSAMSREGFVQTYAYLTAGSYNLVEVSSKAIVNVYGGTAETVTPELDDAGNPKRNGECELASSGFTLVPAEVNGPAFSVDADGLYVIAYDGTLNEIVFDKIETAGIIGAATPGGWGSDTQMTGEASADGATWTVEGVTIDEGEMKFRFNCRWAIDRRLDSDQPFSNDNGYSFFTNFGNSVDQLLPGNEGPNIQVTEYAVYTVSISWDPITGWSADLTKTGEAEPKPEYPAELYMVGATIGGWDWEANGIQMIPVHSNEHLFWRIVWMDAEAADAGIKFAPQKDWIGDFGVEGAATDGVYAKGTQNVPAPATSGYYMVVVNLDAETIEVNEPLVYGIGDAFGTWDAAQAATLFTVDNANEVIKFDQFPADGDLRIHVAASTLTQAQSTNAVDWWQAEFVVLAGQIAYRGTGGDQERNAVTAGQSVSLNFRTGEGTIQ